MDGKREEMKWLVQTLDNLTSNRSDHEAQVEQNRLEQLILRYKNLIPTIDITMTKTEIFSKSYTYRREVHEVCTLLHKVKEQSSKIPVADPTSLEVAIKNQEGRLNQLEQQRANVLSMLQRGKDLLKDQHAPTFVSSEIQQLETSWNSTYGQSIETLKSLKGSQKLWSSYEQQKGEINKLISQAEDELMKPTSYPDTSKDIQNQKELCSQLKNIASTEIEKLRETQTKLADIAVPEKHSTLAAEVSDIEEKLQRTILKVEDHLTDLQEQILKWSEFQSKISNLQNWTQQVAPKAIAETQGSSLSPEERVEKIQIIKQEIYEKSETLIIIEKEFKVFIKGKFIMKN